MFTKKQGPTSIQEMLVYDEAPKWLMRGMLFGAPDYLREEFKKHLAPLQLGGVGSRDENCVDENEIALFKEFVKKLESIKVPKGGELNEITAAAYVEKVFAMAERYLPKFDFFQENLATILGNIKTRVESGKFLLEKPDSHHQELDVHETALSSDDTQSSDDYKLSADSESGSENGSDNSPSQIAKSRNLIWSVDAEEEAAVLKREQEELDAFLNDDSDHEAVPSPPPAKPKSGR